MLVDLVSLKEHYGDDIEIMDQLIEIFEDSYIPTLDGLKDAIEKKDYSNIHLHAHTLKGMISNFFANDLKEIAYTLEKYGKDENIESDYNDLIQKLDEQIPQMITELKGIK